MSSSAPVTVSVSLYLGYSDATITRDLNGHKAQLSRLYAMYAQNPAWKLSKAFNVVKMISPCEVFHLIYIHVYIYIHIYINIYIES